jgi:hypothetical protein
LCLIFEKAFTEKIIIKGLKGFWWRYKSLEFLFDHQNWGHTHRWWLWTWIKRTHFPTLFKVLTTDDSDEINTIAFNFL